MVISQTSLGRWLDDWSATVRYVMVGGLMVESAVKHVMVVGLMVESAVKHVIVGGLMIGRQQSNTS